MTKYIFAVLSGIIFGLTLGIFTVVKIIRRRIKKLTAQITENKLPPEYKDQINQYIEECQTSTEKNLRKKLKKHDPILIVKLVRMIKERKEKEKLYNEVHIPPDEEPEEIKESPEEKVWYPFYLMLHSIGSLYQGRTALSFLELNEKDVIGIFQKVSTALIKLLDGIGIERLKKIKCSFVLDTANILRQILKPLGNSNVKSVYKTSIQGVKEFNKIKNAISLNPFYHLRVYVKKKISNALVLEAVKCAIDIIAIEIVNVYNEKSLSQKL